MKKRLLFVLALAALPLVVPVRAQDKPDEKPEDKKEEPKKDDRKAPDPSKSAVVGEVLAPGTVKRAGLFPLEEGRRWRYDLKTWLATTSGEDGAPEEAEPPRLHRLEVKALAESVKVEGKDARCLEYQLDDETVQRAYYFEDGGSTLCPRRVLGAGDHQKDFVIAPPQPYLQGDLAVGAKWEWKGKIGPSGGTQAYEVIREERIKTKAGQFDTVVLRAKYTGEDDSNGVTTKWYAPGVGIVREETEVKADSQIYRTEAVLVKADEKKAKDK